MKACRKATSGAELKKSKEAVPVCRRIRLQERVLQLPAHVGMAAIGGQQVRKRVPRRLRLVRARLQERRRDDELAGGDDAARLQHPHHLGQGGLGIRDVHEHRMAVSDVEVAVVEGYAVTSPAWKVALSWPPAFAAAVASSICDSSMSIPWSSPGSTRWPGLPRWSPGRSRNRGLAGQIRDVAAGVRRGSGRWPVQQLPLVAVAHRVAGFSHGHVSSWSQSPTIPDCIRLAEIGIGTRCEMHDVTLSRRSRASGN